MTEFDAWYAGLTEEILTNGIERMDRTGTGTKSIFSTTYTHNLIKSGFPILQLRQLKVQNPLIESLGFIKGIHNSEWFNKQGCPFWNEFGLEEDFNENRRRFDYELIEDYASENGKYDVLSKEYQEKRKEITKLSYDEGLKKILDSGISLYVPKLKMAKGELGPIYGVMWRHWPNPDGTIIDQVKKAYNQLRYHPNDRRILVSGWNPSLLPDPNLSYEQNIKKGKQCLPPCHVAHEYYSEVIPVKERIGFLLDYNPNGVTEWESRSNKPLTDKQCHSILDDLNVPSRYLDICWEQRSWDLMLGCPSNIIGYSAMLMMMAHCVNMVPRFVKCNAVNVHIYSNHFAGAEEIVKRYKKHSGIRLPRPHLKIVTKMNRDFIDEFEVTDFELSDYNPLSHISFPIAF